jgi:hypothetical protein
MRDNSVLVFASYGIGDADEALQLKLAGTFLGLRISSGAIPSKICLITNGVRLACAGSPVLEALKQLETAGVEIVLCRTCLDYLGLLDRVQVGIVGGMPDIIEAMDKAEKVIRL